LIEMFVEVVAEDRGWEEFVSVLAVCVLFVTEPRGDSVVVWIMPSCGEYDPLCGRYDDETIICEKMRDEAAGRLPDFN